MNFKFQEIQGTDPRRVISRGHVLAKLDDLLHVETKDPLLRLVRQQRIARESVRGLYLYCSTDAALRERQLLARRERQHKPAVASSLAGGEAVAERAHVLDFL